MTKYYSSERHALAMAQSTADANAAPVAVLARDGWYTVCEEPPDDMDPSPLDNGWSEVALVEPMEWAS